MKRSPSHSIWPLKFPSTWPESFKCSFPETVSSLASTVAFGSKLSRSEPPFVLSPPAVSNAMSVMASSLGNNPHLVTQFHPRDSQVGSPPDSSITLVGLIARDVLPSNRLPPPGPVGPHHP